jgi:hypothetical protein
MVVRVVMTENETLLPVRCLPVYDPHSSLASYLSDNSFGDVNAVVRNDAVERIIPEKTA